MRRIRDLLFLYLLTGTFGLGLSLTGTLALAQGSAEQGWQGLEPGLEIRHWPSGGREQGLTILRIDPDHFYFALYNTLPGAPRRTVLRWLRDKGLVAAINASMYWEDQQTSTGLMRTFSQVNNGHIHPDFGAFFVCHPQRPDLPAVDILDRELDPDCRARLSDYATVVQNYRLLDAKGRVTWQPSTREYSSAVVAEDLSGRILFILQQAPKSMHELGDKLQRLDLHLGTTMFVEGGVEASMAVKMGGQDRVWNGRYDSHLFSTTVALRPVPNILGVLRRRPCNQGLGLKDLQRP